jgi:hypothetical protein
MSTLYARTATGGAVARTGFGYQDTYALLQLPNCLARDSFNGVVSELLGDIEFTYFSTSGLLHLCVEAKNNILSQPSFWKEIEEFEKLNAASPQTYVRFRYVSPGTPDTLVPMRNKLKRLRGVAGIYEMANPLKAAGRAEIVQWIVDNTSQPRSRAEFIVDHVEFEDFDENAAEQRFNAAFAEALPSLEEVPPSRLRKILESWKRVIATSAQGHVSRHEIEDAMLAELNESERAIWRGTPSVPLLVTGQAGERVPDTLDMTIDVRPFIDDTRAARTTLDWEALRTRSEQLGEFLLNSRPRRRVKLDINLRMSSAVVLGSAFKATKGHALWIQQRGVIYELDKYEERKEPYFDNEVKSGIGSEGVVSIQIGAPTRVDVQRAISEIGCTNPPYLFVESVEGISDLGTLNRAVAEAKRLISSFRSDNNLLKIHVFIKGPSFFAMALGHRLNAFGRIQLYDWVESAYVSTALI